MRSKYRMETLDYYELAERAIVPRFQRKLVWSKNQKQEFIETLHNGYPFGALLIYKDEKEEKYSIIDGLQRYSTFKDFKDHPQNYIDFSEQIDEIYKSIQKDEIPVTTQNNLKKKIEKGLKEFIKVNNANKANLDDFIIILSKYLPDYESILDKNARPLSKIMSQLEDKIISYIDVSKVSIPTIVFTGDVSELATVFENLNKSGKKLSKYQVFAAQWDSYVIDLSEEHYNQKLLDITIERYNNLIDSREIEIENFSEKELRTYKKISMSEFCFAIGKMILEEMPAFWDSDNEDLANQLGYSSLAIVFGISNKKIHTLIDKHKLINDSNFVELLTEKILEIYRDINSIFTKPFTVPGIKSKEMYGGKSASNFQILSFFGSLWNIKYGAIKSDDIKIKPKYKHRYKLVEENLLRYFIYDVVTSKWSGTGDTKLDRVVIEQNDPYQYDLGEEKLLMALYNWYESLLQKNSVNFESISRMLYTVWTSFYSDNFNENYYDREHVISKYHFTKIKDAIIPGGSLGNFMYLDTHNNRSKQELSLYDNLKPGQLLNEEYFNFQYYPTERTFDSIRKEIEGVSPGYKVLKETIEKRGKRILDDLVKKLNHY